MEKILATYQQPSKYFGKKVHAVNRYHEYVKVECRHTDNTWYRENGVKIRLANGKEIEFPDYFDICIYNADGVCHRRIHNESRGDANAALKAILYHEKGLKKVYSNVG